MSIEARIRSLITHQDGIVIEGTCEELNDIVASFDGTVTTSTMMRVHVEESGKLIQRRGDIHAYLALFPHLLPAIKASTILKPLPVWEL